jgi:tetratricopeptide (TPR) repeat protein
MPVYSMGNFESALELFQEAYNLSAPEEVNPFILLRLGQCYRRLGNDTNAAEYLLRVYMLEGEDIFEEEEDDFVFLKNTVPLHN